MPRKRPKKLPTGIRWKDGSYRAIYRDPEGRQVEEATGQNLEEAVAHRRRQMKAVRDGSWVPRSERRAMTLAAYFERWLPQRRKQIRSWKAEAKWIRKYALPILGETPLEELRPKDVAKWVEQLQRMEAGLRELEAELERRRRADGWSLTANEMAGWAADRIAALLAEHGSES